MKKLKNTTVTRFFKGNAEITIEVGTNANGNPLRILNQVNTANIVIDDIRDSFEDGLISEDEIIKTLNSQGFYKK